TTSGSTGTGGNGGAIHNDSTITVTNSTFTGNSASTQVAGAGGAVSNAGALTVSGSTFNANSGRTGGAIFVFTGKTTITNSTFGGNTASANNPGGGAITTQAAEPVSLTSSTLSGNTAPAGGGLYSTGDFSLLNTIVAGNNATDSTASGPDVANGTGALTSL